MSVIDKFMTLMMEREEEGSTTPIIQHGNDTFIFIKCNNLYRILGMLFSKRVHFRVQYFIFKVDINPIGPRILLKHAFLSPGFLANFEQFHLFAFKNS